MLGESFPSTWGKSPCEMSERHIPLLPSRSSNDSEQYVEVEMPLMTIWQKIEVYLEMITVPLIIVGVVVVGFVVRFFREIIIPTILALFLFQISKPIVLRLHKPIIPYFAFEYPELSEEEKRLVGDSSTVCEFNSAGYE